MASRDEILNIDVNYVDSNGAPLLGNNDVLSVFYYNATTSGTEEAWTKNWDTINTIPNYDFSTTITGGADWVYSSDDTIPPYTSEIARSASWHNTDLLRDKTVTSSGQTFPYNDDYVVDPNTDYGWETNGTGGPGAYALAVDMGSIQDVNYAWFVPGFDTDTTKNVRDFRIGVSDTGGELDYTIVASGTAPSGTHTPVISFIGNRQTRYVKFYIDSNWGHATRTRLHKISAYYEPDWSLIGYNNTGFTAGSEALVEQEVNLTNINTLFVDSRAYMSASYQRGNIAVLVSGTGGSTTDTLKEYNWSTTGSTWLDANDENHWTRWEEEIDVSSYTGNNYLKLRIFNDGSGRLAFRGYIDNVQTQPLWYRESKSTTRGTRSAFPDEVYLIADRGGLSIVDKTTLDLWMRFDVGPGYMLETAPRDIYADEGKIYLATSRGLVVVDIAGNRAWKYSDSGLEYRMSLGRRNEPGFWYTEDAGLTLPSTDVYSVDGGTYAGTDFVVIGHGAGLSYIVHGTTVNNSAFTYTVRKVQIGTGSGGAADRVVYIGGFDSSSRVSSIENVASIQSDNFTEGTLLFSNEGLLTPDTISGTLSSQWLTDPGALGLTYGSDYISISGTKSDYGDTTIIQNRAVPNRSFTASVDVKLDNWVDRAQGGLHFGVTSAWPYATRGYYDTSKALMLSAVNGVDGLYFQDETFSSMPDLDTQWVITPLNPTATFVGMENGVFKMSGPLSGFQGTQYTPGLILGTQKVYPSCPDFTAKVKVKVTGMTDPTSLRQASVLFGVTDGQYLGEGAGTHGMAVALYLDDVDPNPAIYCMATKSDNNGWSWDTTNSGILMSDDLTTAAPFRTWEFTYNASSKTLNGAIDGIWMGEVTDVSLSNDIGIIMGPASNGSTITTYFKDFEIDFGALEPHQKKKYTLMSYDNGTWTRPTLSGGVHLNGLIFSPGDGSYTSNWKTWAISYDGTTLSGSVDGTSLGVQPVSLDLGDNHRVFMHYNMPALVSGTEKSVDIKIRNFTISYNDVDTVIAGSPNGVVLENGTYLGSEYNTLYVPTSSGVNQLVYQSGTVVSGTPYAKRTYGVLGSPADYKILHGNVANTLSVEPEVGAVFDNGLLYTGSSRYVPQGWERLVDRPGDISGTIKMNLAVREDGSNLLFWYWKNAAATTIYVKELGTVSSSWYPIAQSDQTEGYGSITTRGFMTDMGNGNLYCISHAWLGIYSFAMQEWLLPTNNVGTGPVSTGGGEPLEEWDMAPDPANSVIHFVHDGQEGVYFLEYENWAAGEYGHSEDLPLLTNESAIAFSDVDDALYAWQTGSTNNFFRRPSSSLVWSGALADSPFDYDFTKGISAFYRPYDESVYFVMKGLTDTYGRKIVRYDIKSQVWSTWGIDVPKALQENASAAYSVDTDTLYIIAGKTDATVYKYVFPRDSASRFVSWGYDDEQLTPEESTLARYRKVSFDSSCCTPSDSLDATDLSPIWFAHTYGNGASITTSASNVNFTCTTVSPGEIALITRAIPIPVCDFTASLKVRVNDMARSTGELSNGHNSMVFGITDYKYTPGYIADTNTIELGMSVKGNSGAWMVAHNSKDDDVNKYSLLKNELGSETYYNTTQYQNFFSTDVGASAEYHEWGLEYTHSTKTLDTFIDGVSVGSVALTGQGFPHGASLQFGVYRELTAASGIMDIDVKDFRIAVSGTTGLVSNYLEIRDEDEYGYQYYEKLDRTIVSGTGYTYESDWQIETYSLTSNSYVTTVGCLEDGNRKLHLAALYSGDSKIGLYTGGDPRLLGSYTTYDHDWTTRSTYKMVYEQDNVNVYVDGGASPAITVSYESLPRTWKRRSCFGTMNPDSELMRYALSRDGFQITTSGSWTEDTDAESSYYGGTLKSTSSSVDNKVIYNFDDSGGGYLYMFYEAYSTRPDNTPVTVYHNGVLDLPVADTYTSNPINTVNDNVDEYANADTSATTLLINQQRLADGRLYSDVGYGVGTPTGWVYLGRYSDISHVVITCNGTSTNDVNADTLRVSHTNTQPRSRSVSRVYGIAYTIGRSNIETAADYKGGFTIVDMSTKTQVDAYSDTTSPDIIDSNIYDFDVVQ